MRKSLTSVLVGAAVAAIPVVAAAHVSVISGAATANLTQEVTFGVGHGCAGADTYKVRIEIPAGVTSVRPMRSDFGKIGIEKDAAGTITAVSWQKVDADANDADIAYHKLIIRLKVPDQPFASIYFPSQQTCRAANGTLSVTNWVRLPSTPAVDGGADEPSPELLILPARRPGWNKYVVARAIPDLSVVFGDAAIVWKASAAYSANPTTVELINGTAGVTVLSALAANDEVWVKY